MADACDGVTSFRLLESLVRMGGGVRTARSSSIVVVGIIAWFHILIETAPESFQVLVSLNTNPVPGCSNNAQKPRKCFPSMEIRFCLDLFLAIESGEAAVLKLQPDAVRRSERTAAVLPGLHGEKSVKTVRFEVCSRFSFSNADRTLDIFDSAPIIDIMVELTRKQREIESRTAEILRVARPILIADGFQGLSMDRVASQMEYAKGTIYNHFPNKEEIVLALAVQSMELRRQLFEKASQIDRSPRLRMMALGAACEFFTQHCTEDFAIEQWVRNQGVWDKSTEQRQSLILQCEGRCMELVSSIVQDAISDGALKLPDTLCAEELVFGFWAINYGSQILTFTSPSLPALGIFSPSNAIRIHCCTLLNGFHWSPLMDHEVYLREMATIHEQLATTFWAIKNQQT